MSEVFHKYINFGFRERQSPKEVAKKSDVKSPKIMETKTSKPSLDSEFDLLSLNKPSNTNAGAVVPEAPKSSVTDLLGLGGKSIKNSPKGFGQKSPIMVYDSE